MILTFRPLKVRPAHWMPMGEYRPHPFRAGYSATLTILDDELDKLGATDAFLQVDTDASDLRLDGQLRAQAVVNHPGVILTIETREHGTLVYETDAFSTWKDNLRAIALGLHDLRRLDRYGIAQRGQQYAGFRELGAGTPMGAGDTVTLTREQAWLILSDAAEIEADDITTDLATVYRRAVKRHHPDHGGDPDLFRLITQARNLLAGEA